MDTGVAVHAERAQGSPESPPEWLRLFVINPQLLRLPSDLAYRAVAISRTHGCAVEIAAESKTNRPLGDDPSVPTASQLLKSWSTVSLQLPTAGSQLKRRTTTDHK